MPAAAPIEIFISYRRGDAGGHARNLHGALKLHFEAERIFFDFDAIEPGQDFPAVIDAAVTQCRVLLALIGPGWLEATAGGQRRLDDPADFVRREIALALRLGKHVIPVLIDQAPMPQAQQLPEELAPLARRDAHGQHGKTYEYEAQLARLVALIGAQPGVTPPRAARVASTAATAGCDKLPVLCDRIPQDDAAGDAVRAALRSGERRPIVLVLHGRTDEEHYAFVDRIEGFSLPRLLKGSSNAAGVQFVRINDPLPVDAGQAAFDRRLREHLGEALEAGLVDDDAALLRQLQQLKLSTLVCVITWHASELGGDAQLPLQRVFDYWARFPALGSRLLAGCIVCIKYDRAAGGSWLGRLFGRRADERPGRLRQAIAASTATFGADARVAWCVAQELPSVTLPDLHRWVAEVARLLNRRFHVPDDQLEAIIGGERQPMQRVLPALERLISSTTT